VDVACFIGAVAAARASRPFTHRMLPGQRDLNRCFRAPFDGECGAVAREVLGYLEGARLEAVVDLHNNTGHNPAYAITTHATAAHFALASVFVTRVIHSALRLGSLMEAFAPDLPVVTVECGRAGSAAADAFARDRLAHFVELPALPTTAPSMHVLVDPVRVTLRRGSRVAFGQEPRSGFALTLRDDIDRHNFRRLEAGTHIGWLAGEAQLPLEARGSDGRDTAPALFEARGDALVTARPLLPVMMTTDPEVAEADCLFYVVRDGAP
jgi:hypothetical protein